MFNRLFLPVPVATAITLFRSVKYIREGLKALWARKSSANLDGARGGFSQAPVMFVL